MSLSETPQTPAVPLEPMPPGVHNVYIFEIFNTVSWSIVLGAPMLLFLQHLNATATILAVAASLSPLLNILQIPAARFVEQVGYRRFVLSGWTSRSFFVIGMTVVAFLPDTIDRTTRIAVMLFLSFIFNTLRGISVCGVLPWFTHIIPESRRGEFLARDQMAGALSYIACLFVSGSLLKNHEWYSFGIVFSMSAVGAFASLFFLRQVPDVPVEKIVPNAHPLPWRDMFFYPPFLRYIRYNVIINLALGASNVFWVRYFSSFLHVSNAKVLYVASLTTIVVAVSLFMVGPLIDRAGNKPALTFSGILLALHFTGWALVAAGVLPFNRSMLCVQTFTAGLGGALWNLANVRIVMSIVPEMGRAHFLALYSVASNLTLGLVPLLWGPVMDYLAHWHFSWGYWQWNSYSLLYATLACTIVTGLWALRFVEEPKTMTWNVFMHELLVQTPSRGLSRLIGRLRGHGVG
jgi:MFS family permease